MDATSASEQPASDQKKHNGIPVLAASVVLVFSALGWQLMGAGVVVHFLVLLSGIAIGALFRQSAVRRDAAADRATAATATAAAARTIAAGATASDVPPANGNDGGLPTPASGQESLIPSFLSNAALTCGMSSTAGASPLHWVGETMEGSINWLCGNNNDGNGRKTAAAEQSNGRGSTEGRRRSRSTGGGSPSIAAVDETAAVLARSAATSPARAGGVRRAGSDAALPALGAGIPQEQQGQAPPPARSRLWSRTFGAAGSGVQPPPEGFGKDAYDGDDSVEEEDDGEGGTDGDEESLRLRGAAGMGDWLVGAGLGDTR